MIHSDYGKKIVPARNCSQQGLCAVDFLYICEEISTDDKSKTELLTPKQCRQLNIKPKEKYKMYVFDFGLSCHFKVSRSYN